MTRPIRLLTFLAALVIAGACAATGSSQNPGSAGSSSNASGSMPSGSIPASSCPTAQPAPLAAGEKRLITIETAMGRIQMTVEANLSPIAAGNFVALASCGFYDGVVFHRLVPGFVIQGGDPTGAGTGGPGYTIRDEPVTTPYRRGTVAMARTAAPDSVGSQFFIVLDDKAGTALADPAYNNYQIIGAVTAGMDVVDAIAAMPNAGPPNNEATSPVAMDTVTVSTP